jgi:hypothetical protein
LVNESGEELSDRDLEGLLQRRRGASDNLKGRIVLTAGLWAAVDRFSKMKTDLTYGRATPRVGDAELGEFEAVVTEVLSSLFAVALDA